MNINRLEKIRLKLFKKLLISEQKMDTCSWKEYLNIQYDYGVTYKKLTKIDKIIKSKYPSITDELDYMDKIDYRKLK